MGRPFRQMILKMHARCDLACDHCYVYTMRDQRWRLRDRTMSSAVIRQVALRIEEHVRAHRLSSFEVVFHGGEPLLAGIERLSEAVRVIGAVAPVRFALQTNGLLLDASTVEVLADLGIRVGVSLDGDREAHDRHRRRPDGSGSYDAVAAALRLLAGRSIYGGVLCTVDLANDPVRTYEALLPFAPPAVDFLLPNANWSSPPPPGAGPTPYADWLTAVFDRWYEGGETQVRGFGEIINVLLGGSSSVEGFGTSAPATVVIETDGAIEVSDMLTSAFEGAAATGLSIGSSSLDEASRDPGFRQRPCSTCDACDLREVCGGGVYAHRYRAGSFAHPSVYCADLYALISHVRERLVRDVAALPGVAR